MKLAAVIYLLLNACKLGLASTPGTRLKYEDLVIQPRIVGGQDADIGEYPFFGKQSECQATMSRADIVGHAET